MDNVNRSGHLQKCPAGVLFSAEAVFVGPALRYFTSSNFIIFLAHFPTLVQFDTVLISSQHHYSASDHISRPDRKAQVITNTFCKHSFFGQRLCKHDQRACLQNESYTPSAGKANSKRIVNVTKPKGNRLDTRENTGEGQHSSKTKVCQQKVCNSHNENVYCVRGACMFNLQI